MKRIFIISLFGGLTFCPLMAQQTDPMLTGAVVAQSEMLKKIFKDREKTQKKIIAAETAVTVTESGGRWCGHCRGCRKQR